jgi:hypothetical protein
MEEFDRPLNRAEPAECQRDLSMLSPQHVAEAYRQAHEACGMEGDRLPSASAVQGLMTAWKLMWKWMRRGPIRKRMIELLNVGRKRLTTAP